MRRQRAMAISELTGKALTVLGPVSGDELGITLTHEHLLFDARQIFMEPGDAMEKAKAYDPISMENIGHIRHEPLSNFRNLWMLDEETAINDALRYKLFGGKTIVDCTYINAGRNPDALVRISKATGLNVIMGTGYFRPASLSPGIDAISEKEIADRFVLEITTGVGANRVPVGIIGELFCSAPLADREKKILHAGVRAQQITGAPLSIHPGYAEDSALEIVDYIKKAGADINRTIICHIDVSVRQETTRRELAGTGCYMEYDHLGATDYYSPHVWTLDLPDDLRRMDEIKQLIGWGHLNQILLSHDIAGKYHRSSYGGWGYEHLLQHFVPLMRRGGVNEEEVQKILVENPKRVLCFV